MCELYVGVAFFFAAFPFAAFLFVSCAAFFFFSFLSFTFCAPASMVGFRLGGLCDVLLSLMLLYFSFFLAVVFLL